MSNITSLDEHQQQRLEAQRIAQEDARNTGRFFAYNNRRKRAGLPELEYSDYLDRKYGMTTAINKARCFAQIAKARAESLITNAATHS